MTEVRQLNERIVPAGWQVVALGDVCEVQLGKMLSPKSKEGMRPVPYIRNANVQWGRFDLRDVAQMDFSECEEIKFTLKPGDLLVCEGGEPGRAAVWDGEIERCCYQKALHRIRPLNDAVDPYFVMFRLRFGAFEGEFADQNEKTTIAHLPEIRLVKLRFALPHLREQRRIVARLSVQLAEVERARSAVEQQLKAAEALRSAVLRSVFSQNCNEVWPSKRLAEAAEISAGVTLGRKLPDDGVRRVPYLTVANVKDGWLDLTNVKSTDATEWEIERGRLVFGDLLLTEGGDPDKLGRGTYWRSELTECILQNHIFRVRFSSDADPDFMSFQFGSDYGKSFFLRHANQTTGIATINRKVLGNFPVLIPSLQVQREVSARISSELKEAEQLRENLLKKLRALEKLPAALLREAFGGRM